MASIWEIYSLSYDLMKKKVITCLYSFLLVFNLSCLAQSRMIIVDKPNLQLSVIECPDTLLSAPICAWGNFGDKLKKETIKLLKVYFQSHRFKIPQSGDMILEMAKGRLVVPMGHDSFD